MNQEKETPEKQAPEEDTQGRNALDVLFPHKTVTLAEGVDVEMHPISLPDLSKVMGSFLKVAQLYTEKRPEQEIAIICLREIVELLPFCTDYPLDKIPHYAFPDLLEAFLDLNMTDDLVKKWTALTERVKEAKGSVGGQSKKA